MNQSGSLLVKAYVSTARIPIPGATAAIFTRKPGERYHLLAVRITDESGIAGPVELPAGTGMGLTPESPPPFLDYQLMVEHPDYRLAVFEDLQIFPGVETLQEVPLIPLSVPESPDSDTTTVTPQEL